MDIKVTLKLLLSSKKDTFTITGPCVCCDQPSEAVWTYNKEYNLERWVASSGKKTGNVEPIKQGYKDKDGNSAKGEIELNLPYCSAHLDQTKRLHNYHSKQQTGLIIVGVIAIALYFILFGLDWMRDAETTTQMGFRTCAMPIFVLIGAVFLGTIAFTAINESKATKPEFIDYPIDSSEGGGSGLAIRVDGEEAGRIGQYVKYFLNLDFKNVEAAKQFKQKYPGAVIMKGKELLE